MKNKMTDRELSDVVMHSMREQWARAFTDMFARIKKMRECGEIYEGPLYPGLFSKDVGTDRER